MDFKTLLCSGGSDIIVGPLHDYHGFLLGRHVSRMGTVITYKADDETLKDMLVLDAKYRSVQKFGTFGVDVSTLTNFKAQGTNGWMVCGNEVIDDKTPMPDGITNGQIFNQWSGSLAGDKSAKENCDIWMTYNDTTDTMNVYGVPAVAWCRAQKVNGQPCDLPNLYQLIVIWVCGDKLDEIDPTAASYSDLKLGYTSTAGLPEYGRCKKFNGQFSDYLASSTEFDAHNARGVSWQGRCSSLGKQGYVGVAPIMEL